MWGAGLSGLSQDCARRGEGGKHRVGSGAARTVPTGAREATRVGSRTGCLGTCLLGWGPLAWGLEPCCGVRRSRRRYRTVAIGRRDRARAYVEGGTVCGTRLLAWDPVCWVCRSVGLSVCRSVGL